MAYFATNPRVGAVIVVLALVLVACDESHNDGSYHAGVCSPSFNACGGEPMGTWDIVGLCSEGDLKSVVGANGTLACEHMTSYADLTLSGSLTYDYEWVERDTTTTFAFSTSYTPACAAARGAGVLDASVCLAIEADIIDSLANAQGGCDYNGTNCNCDFQGSATAKKKRGYTTQDDAWIIEDSGYQICVEGNTMTQRQVFLGDMYLQTVLKKR